MVRKIENEVLKWRRWLSGGSNGGRSVFETRDQWIFQFERVSWRSSVIMISESSWRAEQFIASNWEEFQKISNKEHQGVFFSAYSLHVCRMIPYWLRCVVSLWLGELAVLGAEAGHSCSSFRIRGRLCCFDIDAHFWIWKISWLYFDYTVEGAWRLSRWAKKAHLVGTKLPYSFDGITCMKLLSETRSTSSPYFVDVVISIGESFSRIAPSRNSSWSQVKTSFFCNSAEVNCLWLKLVDIKTALK